MFVPGINVPLEPHHWSCTVWGFGPVSPSICQSFFVDTKKLSHLSPNFIQIPYMDYIHGNTLILMSCQNLNMFSPMNAYQDVFQNDRSLSICFCGHLSHLSSDLFLISSYFSITFFNSCFEYGLCPMKANQYGCQYNRHYLSICTCDTRSQFSSSSFQNSLMQFNLRPNFAYGFCRVNANQDGCQNGHHHLSVCTYGFFNSKLPKLPAPSVCTFGHSNSVICHFISYALLLLIYNL